MASFRNLLGLPVRLWDNRAAGQVLQLSSDKEHWEFGAGSVAGQQSVVLTTIAGTPIVTQTGDFITVTN